MVVLYTIFCIKQNKLLGTYDEDNQVRFKNLMSTSSLCDYSDAYALFERSVTVANTVAQGAAANNDKKVTFKNSALFINCRGRTNNAKVGVAHDMLLMLLI